MSFHRDSNLRTSYFPLFDGLRFEFLLVTQIFYLANTWYKYGVNCLIYWLIPTFIIFCSCNLHTRPYLRKNKKFHAVWLSWVRWGLGNKTGFFTQAYCYTSILLVYREIPGCSAIIKCYFFCNLIKRGGACTLKLPLPLLSPQSSRQE